MAARLLKGKDLSDRMRADIKERAAAVAHERGTPPRLAIVSIGGDPASQIFLKSKLQAAKEVGIETTVSALPGDIREAEVLRLLSSWAGEPALDGIILELPLPEGLDARRVVEALPADRDVEGVAPANIGRLYAAKSFPEIGASEALIPCTAQAIVTLALEGGLRPKGAEAVVVGRSNIVGKPCAHLLSCLDATVTLCHSRTADLRGHLARADVVVAATGRARWLKGEWLKPGAMVLDAGINDLDGKVVGDADFESVKEVAGSVTPVPGGVGPLTVTCLLQNTVLSAERRTHRLKQ